jgi:hypothetical protein
LARQRRARGIAPDGKIRASHWHVLRVYLGLLAGMTFVMLMFGPEALGHAKPGEKPDVVRAWIIIGALGTWALYSAIAVAANQVRLTPDRVERRRIFGVRVLKRSDVVGVRQLADDVFLCTDLKRMEGLAVPPVVLEHPVWAAWIDTLLNLDQQDRVDEQVLQDADEKLGRNTQERRERVRWLGRMDALLGFALMAVGLWAFFWPRPYELAIAVMVLMPLVCGALMLRRVLFSTFSPVVGLLLPPLVLAARASLDFQLLDAWPSIIAAGAVALIGAAISAPLLKTERWGPALFAAALVGGIISLWAWSSLGFANVLLDKSSTRIVQTTVLEREDEDRRAKLVLRDRGPSHETFKTVSIRAKWVAGVRRGDLVCLAIHPGRLGWRWGYIDDCPPAKAP